MKLYPFKFRPIFKRRIWGGQRLREVFGKEIAANEKIGESWEVADLPEDKSVIANGPLEGMTLKGAIEKYPRQITGDANFKMPFPLLIKILDCEDILSVQVHPDEAACGRLGRGEPKTECWYIIDAEPKSFIYKGLKAGVTKGKFRQAIGNGAVAECLQKVNVKAGECHFLPAGTVHSIGAGILIAEIQTPSDTTYRVFDWGRVDESGRGRQMHIEEAMGSINFDAAGEELPVVSAGRIADCEYFKVDKISRKKGGCDDLGGQMKILMVTAGAGRIVSSEGTTVEGVDFRIGETVLIPAEFEGKMHFDTDSGYLSIVV